MARADIETFRDYFLNLIQANLAAKIAQINLEKNDGITLTDFIPDQYTNDMGRAVMNYSQFVFYGFPEILTIPNPRGDFAMDITMSFEIVLAAPEAGIVAENKILRYTRAFAEIITESLRGNYIASDVTVEILAPISLAENLGSQWSKIGGIQVRGTIG
jgi:hypothetical protein